MAGEPLKGRPSKARAGTIRAMEAAFAAMRANQVIDPDGIDPDLPLGRKIFDCLTLLTER